VRFAVGEFGDVASIVLLSELGSVIALSLFFPFVFLSINILCLGAALK